MLVHLGTAKRIEPINELMKFQLLYVGQQCYPSLIHAFREFIAPLRPARHPSL
jgi:hypothetical protein